MEKSEEKKSLLIQSIENRDKGTFALDKMYEYQQYHGVRRETPYVLRGSVIGCQYGTKLSKLDMKLDYGVYKGDLPVMTCADYKPENIPGFGSCLCPEKKYAGCVPMNPEVHPDGEKAVKLTENEYAHICIPRIRSGWKQAEGRTMIYTGEEGYVPALTDEAVLVCQYGGMISVKSVAQASLRSDGIYEEKILPFETEWLKRKQKRYKEYVTMEEMKSLGWHEIQDYYAYYDVDKKKWLKSEWLNVYQEDGTFEPDLVIEPHHRKIHKQDITNLNRVLQYFSITNYITICMFIAQISHECKKGKTMCERSGTDEHPLEDPATRSNLEKWYKDYRDYPFQYRGGGAIQLTHKENYVKIASVIEAEKKEKDRKIPYGTEYLAFRYPWLSAGVFWDWKNLNNEKNFDKMTETINGGDTHLKERKAIYDDCFKNISKKTFNT